MIRTIQRLRFNSPEPSQIRANALGGIFKNGDEDNKLSFDDQTGIVYVKGPRAERALHISACAWIELAPGGYGQITITPEAMATSKAESPPPLKK